MNQFIKSNASKFGLMAAGVAIAYTLIAYLVDINLMVNTWFGLLLLGVNITLLVISVANSKKAMGGFMSFKEAFTSFMATYLVYAIVGTVFAIVLFVFIDPQVADQLQELTIEKTVSMMEAWGAPEASIEEQVAKLEETNNFSLGAQVRGFFFGIIGYAILGLIIAAIMKKKQPEHLADAGSGENL